MVELEDQLRRYGHAAGDAVPSLDPAGIRDRSRPLRALSLVAAGVVVVGAVVVVGLVRSDSSVTTSTGPGPDDPNDAPEVVPSSEHPLPIDEFECDLGGGDGICGDGVVLGDLTYGFGCALPREGDLGPVVGTPGSDQRFVEARAVAGEDPAEVIALISAAPMDLRSSNVLFGQPDTCTRTSTTVLAYGGSWAMRTADDARRIGHLVCEVPAVPDDWRCAAGGPFRYFLDPSGDGTEGDENRSVWLEDAVAETNAELTDGAGPRERLDPLDLVEMDHDDVQRPALRSDEVLYRVGIRIIEQAPGRVVLEVLHQDGQQQGSTVTYRTQRQRFTYEQLGGGPGWWETRSIMAEYSNDNPRSGDGARAAMDADWAACCDRVLVELDENG